MAHRLFIMTAALALIAQIGPAGADEIKNPVALFGGLDKITGRTYRFEVRVGETVQFGTLQVRPRVCYSKPQTEAPQTVSFVQVNNVQPSGAAKRIFSGWMFAASPGLNGVQHPVYDVWLLNCKGGTRVIATRDEAPAAPAPVKRAAAIAPAAFPADQQPVRPLEPAPHASHARPAPQNAGLGPASKPGVAPPFSGSPIEVGDAPGEGPGIGPGAIAPPPPLPRSLRPTSEAPGAGSQPARAPRAGDLY